MPCALPKKEDYQNNIHSARMLLKKQGKLISTCLYPDMSLVTWQFWWCMSFSHTVQNASFAYPLSPFTLFLSLGKAHYHSPKEGAATGNVPDEKRRLGYCECLCCHDMYNVTMTIATNFAPLWLLRSMPNSSVHIHISCVESTCTYYVYLVLSPSAKHLK